MARIVNLTPNVILVSDVLDNSQTQYQDGIKTLTLGVAGSTAATATIPNLQACNSVSLKALKVANSITVDLTVEPSNIIGATGV